MRDYGRVHVSFWSSETTGRLSDTAKLLALYLLTCEHSTIAGVFRLPLGYVAEDLRKGSETLSEGFGELSQMGFVTRCERTSWVWVRKHFAWNPIENPNQRKGALSIVKKVPPECSWLPEFSTTCAGFLGVEPAEIWNPSETLAKGLPKPFRNQEQEQEQEQKQKQEQKQEQEGAPKAALSPSPRGARLPAQWALPKAWGDWAVAEGYGIEAIRLEATKFRNYWTAKSGKDATKLDWYATWQNWMLKEPPKPANGAMSESGAGTLRNAAGAKARLKQMQERRDGH